MKSLFLSLLALASGVHACAMPPGKPHAAEVEQVEEEAAEANRILRLTEEDYRQVAEELGVEVAAMKAVVEIEAGKSHQGFSAPGLPIVNFDLSMFRRSASKHGVNLAKYYKSHPQVFNRSKRGSQSVVNQRLKAARQIHNTAAVEGTFWGMFQIGGFNWKKCGAESIDDFVMKMSRSEHDQLELFANFLKSTGLDKHLRAKNWSAFARGYNGPAYARRGYHTRMASAYQRYKRQQATAASDSVK